MDMISFFFNIQKDTNQLEWKGNIEYLQQFARFEESLKNIRGLTLKMKCEQEDFVGKKASKNGSLYCDDPSSKASPDTLKYNTSFCDFFAVQ